MLLLMMIMTCYRYQFFLQLKQDILQGRVPVTQELMSELGAYVMQCKYNTNVIRAIPREGLGG